MNDMFHGKEARGIPGDGVLTMVNQTLVKVTETQDGYGHCDLKKE